MEASLLSPQLTIAESVARGPLEYVHRTAAKKRVVLGAVDCDPSHAGHVRSVDL